MMNGSTPIGAPPVHTIDDELVLDGHLNCPSYDKAVETWLHDSPEWLQLENQYNDTIATLREIAPATMLDWVKNSTQFDLANFWRFFDAYHTQRVESAASIPEELLEQEATINSLANILEFKKYGEVGKNIFVRHFVDYLMGNMKMATSVSVPGLHGICVFQCTYISKQNFMITTDYSENLS